MDDSINESSLIQIKTDKVIVNLGSGKKPIPYAINVDINPDNNPDIVADITRIKEHFKDNTVDEIHMYHVLEHLQRPHAMQLLQDCYDLLKEDGLIVIECPDLMKCCVNLLQARVNGDEYRIERLGIFGLYGEPDGSIEMTHKWGYWPEYLAAILQEIGFSAAQEELPQTKPFAAKERDFRMVGAK